MRDAVTMSDTQTSSLSTFAAALDSLICLQTSLDRMATSYPRDKQKVIIVVHLV